MAKNLNVGSRSGIASVSRCPEDFRDRASSTPPHTPRRVSLCNGVILVIRHQLRLFDSAPSDTTRFTGLVVARVNLEMIGQSHLCAIHHEPPTENPTRNLDRRASEILVAVSFDRLY
jgi:hypothetical protein